MSDPKSDGGAGAFSPFEEEFFRAGDAISAAASTESGPDHDVAPARTSLWSRLFERSPRAVRPLTEQPAIRPVQPTRPATEPQVSDDEWDWRLAIARARHSTNS